MIGVSASNWICAVKVGQLGQIRRDQRPVHRTRIVLDPGLGPLHHLLLQRGEVDLGGLFEMVELADDVVAGRRRVCASAAPASRARPSAMPIPAVECLVARIIDTPRRRRPSGSCC